MGEKRGKGKEIGGDFPAIGAQQKRMDLLTRVEFYGAKQSTIVQKQRNKGTVLVQLRYGGWEIQTGYRRGGGRPPLESGTGEQWGLGRAKNMFRNVPRTSLPAPGTQEDPGASICFCSLPFSVSAHQEITYIVAMRNTLHSNTS